MKAFKWHRTEEQVSGNFTNFLAEAPEKASLGSCLLGACGGYTLVSSQTPSPFLTHSLPVLSTTGVENQMKKAHESR